MWPFGKKGGKPFRLTYGGRSLGFTPFGVRYVVVTVMVGMAAVNSGSNLLYLVVSMMLSMMIVSGVLSEQTLRRVRAASRAPAEIYAHSPLTLRFTLHNRKSRLASFALTASEIYPDGPVSTGAFVLKIGPGETAEASAALDAPGRGEWVVGGVEVATRFPFGLFFKSAIREQESRRTVYPKIISVSPELLAGLSDRIGGLTAYRRGQGPDVRGIREYRMADDARHIHWKTSARLSRLMSKEFEAEDAPGVTVVLDNLRPARPPVDYSERFEEAVSAAASVLHYVMDGLGRPAGLVTRELTISPGMGHAHFISMMEALTRVAPASTPTNGEAIASALAEGTSVLVGAGSPPEARHEV